MSADTPDVLTACECGHSIDRHHAGTQRGECRTYNCFCTLKPSDVFAARVAAERERIAQAILREPWERWSSEKPPSAVADEQRIWVHGVGCGVRFAARIARGDAS